MLTIGIGMHEAKVAEYVLDLVNESIRDDSTIGNKKLEQIIFDLSIPYTVYPDSFEFYFTELIKGTSLDGVKLHFNESSSVSGFYISSLIFED